MRIVRILAIVAGLLIAGCAPIAPRPPSTPVPPAPTTHYEIVQGRDAALVARLRAAPAGQAEIADGNNPSGDEALLRAKGLVQVGIGHFAERDIARAREEAVNKGRDVGADKVLIYAPADTDSALVATYYVRLQLPFGAIFRELTAEEREMLGSPGVQISEVVGGTPAAKANLLEGDFVLKFNHAPVQDKAAFQKLLQEKMGQTVKLTVRRAGMTLERSVKLGVLP